MTYSIDTNTLPEGIDHFTFYEDLKTLPLDQLKAKYPGVGIQYQEQDKNIKNKIRCLKK